MIRILPTLALCALLVSTARADVIAVINGVEVARTSGGGDLNIDVGEIGSDTTVRIFDEDASSTVDPTLSVGTVTIEGSVEDESGARLFVLVSPAFVFPNFGLTTLRPGVVDFGNSGGGLVFANNGLRDASILALACTGDINGAIDVGRIRRIQAFGRGSPLAGGSINANITTHTPDVYDIQPGFPPFLDERSINTIQVARSITGNITALGIDPTPNDPNSGDEQPAGIQRIWVGPAELEDGIISGGIRAELGTIGVIYTTAPIGTFTAPVSIVAGNGIGQIRAVSPGVTDGNGNPIPFAKDFHAEIVAHKQMLDARETFVFNGPAQDGVLALVETAGDITGEIRAANIMCPSSPEGGGTISGDFGCVKPGIYCRGTVTAPITIDYNLLFANIIAHAFAEPITIGRFAKGAIVATGAEGVDGAMDSITIGRGELPPLEPDVMFSPYWQYAKLGPGLCGVEGFEDHPPVLVDDEDWFGASPVDGGAVDGVVRASTSIGTVDIASLSLVFDNTGESGVENCKHFAPRVESPLIGSLTIDDIRDGSVWSGLFSDSGNEFATIGHVTLGCLGPPTSSQGTQPDQVRAAVWMRDWTTAVVTGNVFGVIHVPIVPVNRSIRIGERLANWYDERFQPEGDLEDEPCRCLTWTSGLECSEETSRCPSRTVEMTPRDTNYPFDENSVPPGRVWVHQASELLGQIVINGDAATVSANPPAAPTPTESLGFWSGIVEVDTQSGLATLSADPALAGATHNLAPAYRHVSDVIGLPSDLGTGGGAVGLVPYQFYGIDSSPFFKGMSVFPVDPTAFAGGTAIKIRFYGPVTATTAAGAILIEKVGSSGSFNSNFDISFQFVNGFQREIRISPASGGTYTLGDHYLVTPILEGEDALRCDLLSPGAPQTVVADFTYEFEFVAASGCDADFNNDGNIDPDDLGDFINCYFAEAATPSSCPEADFNDDSFVDPDDLGDFINTYFSTVGMGC